MAEFSYVGNTGAQGLLALQVAEESCRRLFEVIELTDRKYVDVYLSNLREQGVYNVRLLLRRLSGLPDRESIIGALVQLKIRTLHANRLSEIIMGDLGVVEGNLIDREVLRPMDWSGDWAELLVSLDIQPALELAEQLLHATTAPLQNLLNELRKNPILKGYVLQDICGNVPVFRETAYLIELLVEALTRASAATSALEASALTREVRGPVEREESAASIGPIKERDNPHPCAETAAEESPPVLGPAEVAPDENAPEILGPTLVPPMTTFSGDKEVLWGHTKTVCCLCLLPNGMLVSGSEDCTLILWNLVTKERVRVFQGHTAAIVCVAALNDGRIISGSWDKTLRIWNLSTGESEGVLIGHEKWVSSVTVLSENRVMSGGHDHNLIVWDVNTATALSVLPQEDDVLSLIRLPNGQKVASGHGGGKIKIWDNNPAEKRVVREFSSNRSWVRCLVALPSSEKLAAGCDDFMIRIWNYLSGECLSELRGHRGAIFGICVLSDGRLISGGGTFYLTDGGDKTIRIWNTETEECTQTLEGHTNKVRCLLPLPDGRIASGSEDHTIALWT